MFRSSAVNQNSRSFAYIQEIFEIIKKICTQIGAKGNFPSTISIPLPIVALSTINKHHQNKKQIAEDMSNVHATSQTQKSMGEQTYQVE